VIQPTTTAERIQMLDALRGFALLGILLVNMAYFSQPVEDLIMAGPVWSTTLDNITDSVLRFFAEGKSYSLLSLLFGLGMTMQMERLETRGVPFAGFHVRRMLVLLGFGLFHAFLIWEGDILVWYAVYGLPFACWGCRSSAGRFGLCCI
jgi:uncharacterized protein